MQVMANLTRGPRCVITIPKNEGKKKNSNLPDSLWMASSRWIALCHIYISSWEKETTVFLLWLTPPEITNDISTGSLSVLKYPSVYGLHVYLKAKYAALSAWTSFTGVPSGTADFTQEAFHILTVEPQNRHVVKGYQVKRIANTFGYFSYHDIRTMRIETFNQTQYKMSAMFQ